MFVCVFHLGVNHGELERCVNSSFSPAKPYAETGTVQAEYVGGEGVCVCVCAVGNGPSVESCVGGELRLPCNSPHTWAAVVCKGAR